MKKLLFLSLLAVGIIASGCKDPEPEIPGPTGTISPFTISVDAVSVDDVTLTVTYNSEMTSYPYVVGVVEKSTVSESGELSDNIATAVMDAVGTSNFTSTDGKYVFEGNQVIALTSIWELEYSDDYYVAVFAVDANGTLLTEVEYQTLSLSEAKYGNPSVSLVSVDYNSIVVDTKLNGYEGTYYVFAHPKEDFVETYGEDAYALAVQYMNQEYTEWGTDLSVVDGYYIFNADATVDVSDAWLLQPSSEYIIGVFGMNATADVLTDVSYIEATTYDPPLEAVELSVVSTSPTSIVVSVTPPVDDQVYIVFPYPKAEFETEFNSDPNDLTSGIIYMLLYYGINPTVADGYYVFEGANPSIDLSTAWTFDTKTEYVICAVMLDDKVVTSSPVSLVETATESYPIPEGDIQSITVSDVSYVDATIHVESDLQGDYYLAPYRTEDLNNEFGGDINALAEWMVAYEMSRGNTFDLEPRGNVTTTLAKGGWAIYPDEEYLEVAFGVLPDGTISTEVHTQLFRTLSSASFTVTNEVVGVGKNSATIQYTPSEDNISYFAGAIKKSEIEGMTTEEIYLYVRKTIDELSLLDYLYYDDYTLQLNNLSAGTEYYAIGFGYFSGAGRASDYMSVTEFSTTGSIDDDLQVPTSVTIPDVDFGSLTIENIAGESNATGYTISISAVPNDKNMSYIVRDRLATVYDYYSEQTDGSSLEDLVLMDLEKLYKESAYYNTTFADYLASQAKSGDTVFDTFFFYNDTEYVLYTYGVDLATAQPLTKIEVLHILINDLQSIMPHAPMANLEPNIKLVVNGKQVASTNNENEVAVRNRQFPSPKTFLVKAKVEPLDNPLSSNELAGIKGEAVMLKSQLQ